MEMASLIYIALLGMLLVYIRRNQKYLTLFAVNVRSAGFNEVFL